MVFSILLTVFAVFYIIIKLLTEALNNMKPTKTETMSGRMSEEIKRKQREQLDAYDRKSKLYQQYKSEQNDE